MRIYLKMVASAILADVDLARPARRKKASSGSPLGKMDRFRKRTVFSGRQDAGLYGSRDACRYIFEQTMRANR